MALPDNEGFLKTKTPEELDQEAQSQAQANDVYVVEPIDVDYNSIANHVRRAWERARQNKDVVNLRLLENLRAFNSEYSPSKLADIRKLNSCEVFLPLTATKCNATISKLNEVFFASTGDKPFDIESTPIPEMPIDVEEEVKAEVIMEVTTIFLKYATMVDPTANPADMLSKFSLEIADRIALRMQQRSNNAIEDLKRKLSDQLEEGNWYEELKKVIADVVIFEFGCLKGPIYRRDKYFTRVPLGDGTYTNQITETIKPFFERRAPFNIYPAPGSEDIKDDFIFDLISLSLKDLYDLIGVEGYSEDEIRQVINEYENKQLTEWTSLRTDIMSEQNRNNINYTDLVDRVDVLEYWGCIKGSSLMDWGVIEGVDDPDKYYDVCVWLIGNHVIKAMLNPDPMGRKPFHITSYIKSNGSLIGGRGLSSLLESFQQIANAISRAIVNNAGIASGPLVEMDDDRLSDLDRAEPALYPWKIIKTNNNLMSTRKAVEFFQPQMVTEPLVRVLKFFMDLSDQYSIPSYSHGDTQVGGAGNTASGLSMLMTASDGVVKNVIKNIDDVISSSIELLYIYDAFHDPAGLESTGDVRIVARGSQALVNKEQTQVRRNEFLQITNNPIDVQILGMDTRRELLKEVAETLDIESLSKRFPILDSISDLEDQVKQALEKEQERQIRSEEAAARFGAEGGGQNQGNSTKKPEKSGSGQQSRVFRQENVSQMKPDAGGETNAPF